MLRIQIWEPTYPMQSGPTSKVIFGKKFHDRQIESKCLKWLQLFLDLPAQPIAKLFCFSSDLYEILYGGLSLGKEQHRTYQNNQPKPTNGKKFTTSVFFHPIRRKFGTSGQSQNYVIQFFQLHWRLKFSQFSLRMFEEVEHHPGLNGTSDYTYKQPQNISIFWIN